MDINQILDQAERLHRGGKLQEAGICYRNALSHAPENADALYGLGTIHMQQKQPKEALKYLKLATSLLPNVPEFLINLAMVEETLGQIEQAKKTYLHAAYCGQNNTGFLINICKKLITLGLAKKAFSYLDAISEQTPDIYLWKARAQGNMGNWGAALKLLNILTAQFPKDADLWREHSTAAAHLREFNTAIKSYGNYMNNKQANGKDFLDLADLYLMARLPKDAMTTLQKAFKSGVDNAEAYLIAGKCARLSGDYEATKEYLKLAIDRRPTYGQAWQLFFEIADKSELPELIVQCLALEKDKDCSDWDRTNLALAVGKAYEKIGRYNDAFLAFCRANNDHKALMIQRGFEYRHKDIEAESKKIIGYYPKDANYSLSKNISPKRPIFILGMPRTGTTLVEKILGCLEGVDVGGENEAFESVARQYYWEITKGQKPEPVSLNADQLSEMQAAYWRKTEFSGPVVTDKMPHNFRHVGLITQVFPDAPVIYMTRDPRDVCLSIYCRLFPDVHSYAIDLEQIAHFYAESERLKNHWLKIFPGHVLEVVYQELIENPIEKTQEIAAFCGLNWQPACLDYHKQQAASFTFSELQVRKPINRDGINRWRHYEKQLQPLTYALNKYGL